MDRNFDIDPERYEVPDQACEAYEQDREEMGVNERWAEDHGYSRGRCKVHGTFWTDSYDGCPSCEPEPAELEPLEVGEEITFDEVAEEPDQMQRALGAYRILQLDNLRKAAREYNAQDTFFIDALKRNGVV